MVNSPMCGNKTEPCGRNISETSSKKTALGK